MNIDTHNIEHINSGDDRLILTEQIGRRLSVLEVAQINVSVANSYDTSPHLLSGTVDLVKHYQRKDFSQMSSQSTVNDTATTSYDKEVSKLDPSIRTQITPATDLDQARADVAQHAAQGMLDIEAYLAGQLSVDA